MISLIAAVAENGVIGAKNDMPWRLSDDLKRFASLTTGRTVILGRKTFESIKNRLGGPLPKRRNVILTRDRNYSFPGCEIIHSASDLKPFAESETEHFVIGGAEIYSQALPLATKMYLTTVHAVIEGDAKFPEFDKSEWAITKTESHKKNEKNDYDTTLNIYERK